MAVRRGAVDLSQRFCSLSPALAILNQTEFDVMILCRNTTVHICTMFKWQIYCDGWWLNFQRECEPPPHVLQAPIFSTSYTRRYVYVSSCPSQLLVSSRISHNYYLDQISFCGIRSWLAKLLLFFSITCTTCVDENALWIQSILPVGRLGDVGADAPWNRVSNLISCATKFSRIISSDWRICKKITPKIVWLRMT